MTLKELMLAEVDTVFLNPDEFAEVAVTHWVDGDPDNTVTFKAVVIWDMSAGTNEMSGQGMSTLDAAGMSLRRSCDLEVEVAHCDPALLMQERDRFLLADGTLLVFLRDDRDEGMTTLHCYVAEHKTTKRSRGVP